MSTEFFTHIYTGLNGHVTINTKSDSGALDSEKFFELPVQRSYMEKYVRLQSDEDVYCSVAAFSIPERSNQDPRATVRVLWADADSCAPENFRVPPSITVETSPDRWHVWWVLDEPISAKEAQEVVRRICTAHADQGCDRGWTMTKLLRVPGAVNTKYGQTYTVEATYTDLVYSLADLSDAYADVNVTPEATINTKVPKAVSAERFEELEEMIEDAGLSDLYLKRPSTGQSWSERMYRLELELFRRDMTPQEVFSVMREAPANKYNPENAGEHTETGVLIPRRNNPDQVIWNEIQKAYAEHLMSVPDDEELTRAAMAAKDGHAPVSFLTLDERELLADNPSFIDDYVDWALSRSPDSAPTYHYTFAWMLLSCAFGDKVYLDSRWHKVYANLWCLILGDSTTSHKSAAKRLFVDSVHAIELMDQDTIDIGSDATVEALLPELGKRDGQVSLIHTDEVAKFFTENMTKNYRSGTTEAYTELYDGSVPVTLRATKGSGNKTRATTMFNFVGVGIRKRVAEILSRPYFESGFLLRMVWSVADAVKYKDGDSDYQQREEQAADVYDVRQAQMVTRLSDRRAQFTGDRPVPMKLDADALARVNEFVRAMHKAASDDDVLEAGVDRLRDSVLKAAALLAYYYGDETIGMYPLLCAIAQGEKWFTDLRRMLGEVSDSAFAARQKEILEYINSGKDYQRSTAELMRKYRVKSQDMNEIIQALKATGEIKQVKGKSGHWQGVEGWLIDGD